MQWLDNSWAKPEFGLTHPRHYLLANLGWLISLLVTCSLIQLYNTINIPCTPLSLNPRGCRLKREHKLDTFPKQSKHSLWSWVVVRSFAHWAFPKSLSYSWRLCICHFYFLCNNCCPRQQCCCSCAHGRVILFVELSSARWTLPHQRSRK